MCTVPWASAVVPGAGRDATAAGLGGALRGLRPRWWGPAFSDACRPWRVRPRWMCRYGRRPLGRIARARRRLARWRGRYCRGRRQSAAAAGAVAAAAALLAPGPARVQVGVGRRVSRGEAQTRPSGQQQCAQGQRGDHRSAPQRRAEDTANAEVRG